MAFLSELRAVSLLEWETSIVWLVLGVALLGILFWRQQLRRSSTGRAPPTAPLGLLETIRQTGGVDAPWFFLNLSRKLQCSVFRLNLPVPGGIYVSGDGALNREILLDAGSDKPRSIYFAFEPLVGRKNIFSSPNDEHWKNVRKGTAPAFSSKEINRMNTICKNLVEQWIKETLEPKMEAGESFDPKEEFLRLTFRVICEAAFEYSPSAEEMEDFASNLNIALQEYSLRRAANPLRGVFGMFLPDVRQAEKACRQMQAFGRQVLNSYLKNSNKSSKNTVIKLVVENPHLKSEEARVAEMLTLLVGGHDTTGHTLSNLFLQLAQHPQIQNKLRSELAQVDRATDCAYLRHVMRECDRMLPTAAMGPIRSTSRSYTIHHEGQHYVIPNGATVFLCQMLPNHDGTVFADPDHFDPMRWEKATPAMLENYLPFATGIRNCMGQALAMSELHTVIPALISRYRFIVDDPGVLQYFLTIKTEGTKMKVTRL